MNKDCNIYILPHKQFTQPDMLRSKGHCLLYTNGLGDLKRFLLPLATFVFVTLLMPFRANAELFVFQSLSFGEFIIGTNNAQHALSINPDGSYTFSDHFIEIKPPRPGIYEIDGLQPNSTINVIVTQIQPMVGNNNHFDLGGFQVIHSNASSAGAASITLGATARTSGNGQGYNDQNYQGQIQIQISY